jgi:hypothetical protein
VLREEGRRTVFVNVEGASGGVRLLMVDAGQALSNREEPVVDDRGQLPFEATHRIHLSEDVHGTGSTPFGTLFHKCGSVKVEDALTARPGIRIDPDVTS